MLAAIVTQNPEQYLVHTACDSDIQSTFPGMVQYYIWYTDSMISSAGGT